MSGGQAGVGHGALGLAPAEDSDKGQLVGRGGHRFGLAAGSRGRLDGQVHRILDDVAGGEGGRFPTQVRPVRRLGDLDG